MGMRRLSIIDLAGGDQPITNEDRSIWVVFNGEIYNYRELAAELKARGHRFSTASDTEVLVHLYEDLGARCVERLRGMFAFAVWDSRERQLLLGRDRLGIKPLYYAPTPHGLVFGSELKALLESPWVPRSIDRPALAAYLQYGYVPDPLCIVSGVAKLAPGHTLMVRDGTPGTPQQYWMPTASFHRQAGSGMSEDAAGEELWTRLNEAVRSHLVSDVPIGAFLSGGVDSSTVVAMMAAATTTPIKTFSVGFREDRFNELPYARRVAECFGTQHHELVAEPEDLGVLDQLLSGFDEPFADPSSVPTFLVSRLASKHVKVVLSGDGGDELFAGYDRYVVDRHRRHLGLLGDMGLGAGLRFLSDLFPVGGGKNTLYNLSLPRTARYVDSISLFPRRTLVETLDDLPPHPLDLASWADPSLEPLSRLQDLDLKTYLPGDILTKVDRMSMANSLEARVPLLDHPLVEFAAGLPPHLRLRGGVTKYLLKRVVRGKIPDEVLDRPKRGFDVPLETWFSGDLPGFFRDQLGDSARLRAIGVRREVITSLMDRFASTRRRDYCERLWALVVLDRTVRRLFGGNR
jgi:asparagine synthase (glutamine-hydrolysing)